jgi:protein-arginine kinase activator protein McsA
MFERKQCPECGDWNTERVHVEWLSDVVEEVRICEDCPTQYTISYGNPYVEADEVPT